MASTFRRSVPTFVNLYLSTGKHIKQNCIFSHQLAGPDRTNTIVNSLCESLRKGVNWDTLSRKYDSTNLNEPIIKKVLLKLKEPIEAKRALSFFHWVAYNKKTDHGLEVYCIIIHILARSNHVNDARGLLESILIKKNGNSMDNSLRFSIVDMLLSTYRITNACPLVFDMLVQTYSKLKMFRTAFDLSCYLCELGVSLSLATFNSLLHSIQKSSDKSGLIWKVYGHMFQKRRYPNKQTVKVMIDELCKVGELQDIVDTIERIHGMRCSDVVIVNTSLVFRMFDEGQIEEVLLLLNRMLQKNLIPVTISYSMTVLAELRQGDLYSAREMYETMLYEGFCPNSFMYTQFIGAYCEKGMVEEALKLMEKLVHMGLRPYDQTYNSLIEGCAKAGNLKSSIKLCEEMTKKGFLPSSLAFNVMVERLCLGGYTRQANKMLTVALEEGFLPDVATYGFLIDGYRRERNILEVLKLYFEMGFRSLAPGLPIFTSLIRTLCEHNKLEEAEKYLTIMKSRSLCPTIDIYEPLMIAHLENGDKGRAHELYIEMLQGGLEVNESIACRLLAEDT